MAEMSLGTIVICSEKMSSMKHLSFYWPFSFVLLLTWQEWFCVVEPLLKYHFRQMPEYDRSLRARPPLHLFLRYWPSSSIST